MARHILIVDDDISMRTALAGALGNCGYKVSLAGNGDETVAILAGVNGNAVDLIIIDIELPRTSGVSLIRKLHEEGSRLPSFIISGADKKFMINMLNRGNTYFIEQVFNRDYKTC